MYFDHIYSSPSRSTSLPKQLFVLLKNKTGESNLCCPHVLACVSLHWSMVSARDCTRENRAGFKSRRKNESLSVGLAY